jgi:hypothetical protein
VQNSGRPKISFALWQKPEIMHGISKFLYSYSFWETAVPFTELCGDSSVVLSQQCMYVLLHHCGDCMGRLKSSGHFQIHIHVTDTAFEESVVTSCSKKQWLPAV